VFILPQELEMRWILVGFAAIVAVTGVTLNVWDLYIAAALLLTGACAGLFAGLLGIGGGIIMVPVLVSVLPSVGAADENIMQVAFATSLAVIIPISLAAARAQWKRKAVLLKVLKVMAPGVAVGAVMGAALAHQLATDILKLIFAVFLVFVALKMLWPSKPREGAHKESLSWMQGGFLGLLTGNIAALLGVGGGTVMVPALQFAGVAMHGAVATSSVLGSMVAVPGSVAYVFMGLEVTGLPLHALGYVWLPGALLLTPLAVFFAPYGVALAHKLPAAKLKQIFGLFLLVIAGKMLFV
jgi:uncharacterized protein